MSKVMMKSYVCEEKKKRKKRQIKREKTKREKNGEKTKGKKEAFVLFFFSNIYEKKVQSRGVKRGEKMNKYYIINFLLFKS